MKFLKHWFLTLIFAFASVGCASNQPWPTKTFDDKYASANAMLTAVNKATTSALHEKAITAKTAQEVLDRSKLAGKAIDYAYSLKNIDLASALNQLAEANKELGDLKLLLASLGVTI